MPAGENCASTATDVAAGSHDRQAAGCSCLPFCFWGSRGPVAPERRRRRRRFRLRLSWFSWPWLRKSGRKNEESTKKGKRRRMLLLCTSLHAKKASTSVSSGSRLLPKVSIFGDAKKQSRGKTRQTVDDTATTTSSKETASARPETSSRQTCPRPADGVRRAPSRRHSLRPDRGAAEPGAGLWTMATTLGVTVFFGRVTAVIFLCSCLYGARFVRAQASGAAKAKSGGIAGGSSRRFGDQVVVDLCTEEHKKKVVMEGLLDRAGTRPLSRFCK